VVGERTAEESSPPGVVEEPGVSRGLHLRLATFSGGFALLFGEFSVLLGKSVGWHKFRLLVGKKELFGLLMQSLVEMYVKWTCEFHSRAKRSIL